MKTYKVAAATHYYSLPRTGVQLSLGKPSLEDKLDKVFQMAEHVDARCVYMLDTAHHRRRPGISPR